MYNDTFNKYMTKNKCFKNKKKVIKMNLFLE